MDRGLRIKRYIMLENAVINQTKPMQGLKDTYGFVNTRDVLDVFASKGWSVSDVKAGSPRKAERMGFQKHLIRLENPQFPSIPGLSQDNASVPQLVLVNSHDGTAAFRLFLGLVRIACLNGIISGTSLRDFKAVHSKNVINKLGEGIEYLTSNIGSLYNQIQELQNRTFTIDGAQEYAKALIQARLENVNNVRDIDYTVPVRRMQDQGMDAFTVLNRVQELMIRGGIHYTYERVVKDATGQTLGTTLVNARTRTIKSVPTSIKLNRLVYDKALEYSK